MQQFRYIIKSKEGIHAKPAMELMRFCKSLSSKVTVSLNGRKADGRNIMALISLRAYKDDEVTFQVQGIEGQDKEEEQDMHLLLEFCKNNL